MTGWRETYRGAAAPWECDVTEHFTMAYYFDRVAAAEANLASALGLGAVSRADGFARRYDVRLVREQRAGGAFHIESAWLGGDAVGQRFGHRVVNSTTGEVTTWFLVHWSGGAAPHAAGPGTWNGPLFPPRAEQADLSRLIPSMAGRVQAGELAASGRLSLAGMVHKFSDAAVQFGAAIGLTADYIKTARRSFSAFELRLRIARFPRLGERYRIDSGLAHLGNTSLRYLHVMFDADGAEIARVDRGGVQLDLDARRPAPLAPELREHARSLLLSASGMRESKN